MPVRTRDSWQVVPRPHAIAASRTAFLPPFIRTTPLAAAKYDSKCCSHNRLKSAAYSTPCVPHRLSHGQWGYHTRNGTPAMDYHTGIPRKWPEEEATMLN